MNEKKDVLRDYLDRLIEAVNDQQFSTDMARDLEKKVRREWAGERPLIRKYPDREERRVSARAALHGGDSVHQVMAQEGISRATVYRLFKKRRSTDQS